MSKVILKLNLGSGRTKLESLKCKSYSRASEIAASRPNCMDYEFIESGHSPVKLRAKKKVKKDDSIYAKIQRGEINMDNIEQMLR